MESNESQLSAYSRERILEFHAIFKEFATLDSQSEQVSQPPRAKKQ